MTTYEIDEMVALAEMANETAMSELAAFGFIASDYRRRLSEYDPDEIVCLYEYGTTEEQYEWGEIEGIHFDEYAPYSLMY